MIAFEDFWNLYDKKVGLKEKIKKKWEKLTYGERLAAMEHIPKYIASQPCKCYRKNPETYINNKSWNDEIIEYAKPGNKQLTAEIANNWINTGRAVNNGG